DDKIIAVQQGRYLGVSFHPELTDDYRMTQYFIEHVMQQ
ncbi:pyridoxal 5'-phosphate synthase glutaminase subunit PdxT, partial [Staphylococcus pseudintermedius]